MGSCLSDSLWRVARSFARGYKDPLGGTGLGEDAGIGQECAHGLLRRAIEEDHVDLAIIHITFTTVCGVTPG